MFIIGLNLHIHVISLSKKENNTITWKLNISNSLILLVLHLFSLIMHVATDAIPDLYIYTGEWFCYTWKVVAHCGGLYHIGHSLVVSILKYNIIVKWEKTITFGENRLKEICFWLNILHPIIGLAIHLMVRPDFIFVFSGISPSNTCLGEDINGDTHNRNVSQSHLSKLCDIPEDLHDNWFYHSVFIGRKILCVLQTIGIYLIALNIFEMFLYYRIFSFAYR